MSDKISADDIRKALQAQYAPPEWYLGFEVGNSTGSGGTRRADAVAINAYPSKGFEIRGFEIKVSKSDLKAEMNDGSKADAIAKFCDYWFLVTLKGLTDDTTLPPTWGVIEYDNGKLKQKKRPTQIDKVPLTSGFLCSMLRGRERVVSSIANNAANQTRADIERQVKWSMGQAQEELKRLKDKLAVIRDATGIALTEWEPTDAIVRKLQTANNLELIVQDLVGIERSAKRMLEDAQSIKEASDKIMGGG